MKRIAILGSGHLGQQIATHIVEDSKNSIVAFFDMFKPVGTVINGIEVIGGNDDIFDAYNQGAFDELVIAVGYNHMAFRKEIFENLKGRIPFYTFIHSTALVDSTAIIGTGSIVYPGCVIDQNAVVGENVVLNLSVTISHDSRIGDHSFISPAVAIAGFVEIGDQCIVGINSTIIDNIVVAGRVQIGGGTVVIKDIEKPGLYVGNPAKFIR